MKSTPEETFIAQRLLFLLGRLKVSMKSKLMFGGVLFLVHVPGLIVHNSTGCIILNEQKKFVFVIFIKVIFCSASETTFSADITYWIMLTNEYKKRKKCIIEMLPYSMR